MPLNGSGSSSSRGWRSGAVTRIASPDRDADERKVVGDARRKLQVDDDVGRRSRRPGSAPTMPTRAQSTCTPRRGVALDRRVGVLLHRRRECRR